MAASYNDGTVQYGSRTITFNTAGVFVADNIEVTRPTNIIERTQQLGEPSGWVAVPGFVTATATLQIANGATLPLLGDFFNATFVASIGSEKFVLVEIGQPEAKDGEKKLSVTFRKAYN